MKYSDYNNMMDERERLRDFDRGGGTSKGAFMPSPQRLLGASAVTIDPSSPGDGDDLGGFQERIIPRKTSVETQTMSDDSYYQRKITPRVPKSACFFYYDFL